jgi:predicted MFS family arabinose efflux permease
VGPIGIFFTFSAIGIMIARLRVGRYYDAQGPQRIIIFSLLALVVALELIAFASTLSTFLICGLIFGIGFGSLQPTLLAVAVQGIEPQRRGAVNGTVMGAFDLGVGMGAFLLGQVVNNWGYAVMYMGTSCIPLAGLFLYMYWERKNAGRRNGRKGFSER